MNAMNATNATKEYQPDGGVDRVLILTLNVTVACSWTSKLYLEHMLCRRFHTCKFQDMRLARVKR